MVPLGALVLLVRLLVALVATARGPPAEPGRAEMPAELPAGDGGH